MGVTYVTQYEQPDGQNIQKSVEDLNLLIEKLGAKKSGLFHVECESFYAPNIQNSKTLHIVHDSEFPASRFAHFEDGATLVADTMLPSLLSKLRAVWQPKKGGKIECKGQRYELGDFLIKVGIAAVGSNTRGIALELEYTPCIFARECWGLITEILQALLGEQNTPALPGFMQIKQAEAFTPQLTVQQYIVMFNNMRKTIAPR